MTPPTHNTPEFTVSEISGALKRMVEENFEYVRVRGEISGWKKAASGHAYFSLKDENACMDAVSWKGTAQRFAFAPQDGLEVIATGRLTTYPGRSKYQIVVEAMEPAGVGALMALLEERKKKLAAEGLFAPERKKKLPFMPQVIGVVTSPTGAVIRDILHRLGERFPVHVIVWPVLVQGEGAAEQIAAAIRGFNSLMPPEFSPENSMGQSSGLARPPGLASCSIPKPELLIVARGGGSIEDLWAFNEEIVVRAAAESAIPLISAVGHETDTTLIDFASDLRAPTPTAAAEMAVPVRQEWLLYLLDCSKRMAAGAMRSVEEKAQRVEALARGLLHPQRLLEHASQRFDDWSERLQTSLPALLALKRQQLAVMAASLKPQLLLQDCQRQSERVEEAGVRLQRLFTRHIADQEKHLSIVSQMLESLSVNRVLERGFALVKDEKGRLVMSASGLSEGKKVTVTLRDGEKSVRVEGQEKPKAASPAKLSQGSLF